jgi:hypothetical protein
MNYHIYCDESRQIEPSFYNLEFPCTPKIKSAQRPTSVLARTDTLYGLAHLTRFPRQGRGLRSVVALFNYTQSSTKCQEKFSRTSNASVLHRLDTLSYAILASSRNSASRRYACS